MLLTTASGYQRIWFQVYWVDTVIIKKMEIRELEAELQWFWTQFRGIFKYKNEMDKDGILIMYNEASHMLKKLADDIVDSRDRLQVQEAITKLKKKVTNPTEPPFDLS